MSQFTNIVNQVHGATLAVMEATTYPIQRVLQQNICKSGRRLDGQVIIVTGSNSGIGKMTASLCAERGAKVILACRNQEKANAAANEIRTQVSGANICVMQLDLNSLQSVRQFAETVLQQEPRIDVLVNNAGIFQPGERLVTEDGFEAHFGINYLAHFLLTILLIKRIQNSTKAKIVNVTSDLYRIERIHFEDVNFVRNYNFLNAYAQSKLAQLLFTKALAKRCPSVNVYAVNPGIVSTDIASKFSYPDSSVYNFISNNIVRDAYEGAQTTMYCIVDEKTDRESGRYYKNCGPSKPLRHGRNDSDATALWNLSMQILHLNDDAL